MSTPVKSKHETVRRYYLPTIDGLEGWAEVIITDGGYFSTVSDYGNYAFAWRSFGECFRTFLLGAEKDADYFTKKLQPGGDGPGDVYDGEATERHIRKLILEYRRERHWSRERAREEWDLLERFNLEWEGDFGEWYRETQISDAYEMAMHRRNPQTKAFVERLLAKRLCPIFRAELEAERVSAKATETKEK
jgi:hypothetical protein